MSFDDPHEADLLAGEYVLGLLAPPEAAGFERELARNPALAATVARWHDRLLAVAPAPEPVEPAPGLWARIERDLAGPRRWTAAPGAAWRSLALWRTVSLAGMLVAAWLAWTLAHAPARPATFVPIYAVVLQSPDDRQAGWLVEVAADRSLRIVPLVRPALQAGRSLELWTQPAGAPAPVSLGLIAPDGRTITAAPPRIGFAADQFFAISLEPAGGSPSGRPTGPIVATGQSVDL